MELLVSTFVILNIVYKILFVIGELVINSISHAALVIHVKDLALTAVKFRVTVMEIPNELVQFVRELIAKHAA